MSAFAFFLNRLLPVKCLRLSISLICVGFIGWCFLPEQLLGLVLATLLCVSLQLGGPIRQGILVGLALTLAVIIAGLLLNVASFALFCGVIITIVLGAGVFLFNHRFTMNNGVQLLNVFLLALFVYLFLPGMSFNHLKVELLAILIGVSVASFANAFIFPFQYGSEFIMGLKPLFELLHDYQQAALMSFAMNKHDAQVLLQSKELAIFSFISSVGSLYPKWVFAYGFNPGLRASLRYFLINIDQVNEIIASLTYQLPTLLAAKELPDCQKQIQKVLTVNIDLISKMQQFFENKEIVMLQPDDEDFLSDLDALSACYHEDGRHQLHLLTIKQDDLMAQALLRDFRDLRVVLLNLLKAMLIKR